MFISERILGHYYLAELNRKGGDMLCWTLVSAKFDGPITRIPSAQVPRKVWNAGYRLLIASCPMPALAKAGDIRHAA